MEFGTKFFFSLFWSISSSYWLKIILERGFLIFLNFFFYFFQNFLARVECEWNSGLNFFFFSFSAYLILFWLKIRPERVFLIFWLFFFGIFLPRSRMNRIRDKIFFHSFSAYLITFWLKIRPERGFLIFCYFFRNFLALVEYEWKSGLKFFSRFLGLSHHVLGRNIA